MPCAVVSKLKIKHWPRYEYSFYLFISRAAQAAKIKKTYIWNTKTSGIRSLLLERGQECLTRSSLILSVSPASQPQVSSLLGGACHISMSRISDRHQEIFKDRPWKFKTKWYIPSMEGRITFSLIRDCIMSKLVSDPLHSS